MVVATFTSVTRVRQHAIGLKTDLTAEEATTSAVEASGMTDSPETRANQESRLTLERELTLTANTSTLASTLTLVASSAITGLVHTGLAAVTSRTTSNKDLTAPPTATVVQ